MASPVVSLPCTFGTFMGFYQSVDRSGMKVINFPHNAAKSGDFAERVRLDILRRCWSLTTGVRKNVPSEHLLGRK